MYQTKTIEAKLSESMLTFVFHALERIERNVNGEIYSLLIPPKISV